MQAPMVSEMFGEACPASAPFFGYMGAAAALIFASSCPPSPPPAALSVPFRSPTPKDAQPAPPHESHANALKHTCDETDVLGVLQTWALPTALPSRAWASARWV
jgi:hypothetical protein